MVNTHGRRSAAGGQPRGASAGPQPVVVSLPEAARMMGLQGAVELAAVQARWAEVAGAAAAAHSWPTSLRHGVLTVAADHHTWAAQLRLLSGQLLAGLQVSCPTVQAIAVQVSLARPGGP